MNNFCLYCAVNEDICRAFRSGNIPLQPQDVLDILWPVATIKWNIHIGQGSTNTVRRSGCGEATALLSFWQIIQPFLRYEKQGSLLLVYNKTLLILLVAHDADFNDKYHYLGGICMCKTKVTRISSFVIFHMLWPLPITKYGAPWHWITSLRHFKCCGIWPQRI